ncbi:MAG: hypothetical protein MSC30_14775 [Gaiellaceae bacterium MAG52_C11]|nr:hypothetical protein [Candidatus Gaiellasilicea maunaloa]
MRILPIAALLAVLALTGCGGSESDVPASNAGPSPAAETEQGEAAPPPGGSGPRIAGTGLGGEALSVADFRGKPLFVNVWSSW